MSYQRVIIMGNIGKIEQRFSAQGDSIVNFSVAVSDRYKKKSGEQVDETEWFNCVSFGKQSEVISQYFQKGSKILIEGSLKTRQWEDNNGQKRYNTDLRVSNFSFVEKKEPDPQYHAQAQQPSAPQAGHSPPQPRTAPQPNPPQSHQQTVDNMASGFVDDKDIPFLYHERFLL